MGLEFLCLPVAMVKISQAELQHMGLEFLCLPVAMVKISQAELQRNSAVSLEF